ncbi:MAG TPA: phosphoribosylformylglycinamidine synthase subunit PurS [Gemmatimonadaceae bacterium]|nr:phosphoribosylformylglycinamidine synthase subunit PurS [Gemmatimonadaceae bacterium]
MTFRVHIHIVPRKGLLDPQGQAVANALHTLGFGGVRDVRIGRHLVVETAASSQADAEKDARAMCEKLLANPVTEDFELERVEAT